MRAYVGVADLVRSLQIMESHFDVKKIKKIVDFELWFLTNRVPD